LIYKIDSRMENTNDPASDESKGIVQTPSTPGTPGTSGTPIHADSGIAKPSDSPPFEPYNVLQRYQNLPPRGALLLRLYIKTYWDLKSISEAVYVVMRSL
jgi:hypothetical protein